MPYVLRKRWTGPPCVCCPDDGPGIGTVECWMPWRTDITPSEHPDGSDQTGTINSTIAVDSGGGVVKTTGSDGGAISPRAWDGFTSAGYYLVGTPSPININNDWSVSYWWKHRDGSPNTYSIFSVNNGLASGSGGEWWMDISVQSGVGGAGSIDFDGKDMCDRIIRFDLEDIDSGLTGWGSLSAWYHHVWVYQYPNFYFYQNNVKYGPFEQPGASGGRETGRLTCIPATSYLQILGNVSAGRSGGGHLDRFCIWNYALSDGEVETEFGVRLQDIDNDGVDQQMIVNGVDLFRIGGQGV